MRRKVFRAALTACIQMASVNVYAGETVLTLYAEDGVISYKKAS